MSVYSHFAHMIWTDFCKNWKTQTNFVVKYSCTLRKDRSSRSRPNSTPLTSYSIYIWRAKAHHLWNRCINAANDARYKSFFVFVSMVESVLVWTREWETVRHLTWFPLHSSTGGAGVRWMLLSNSGWFHFHHPCIGSPPPRRQQHKCVIKWNLRSS